MKTLLIIFLSLTGLTAFSQIDSNYMKVSITIQARDALYIQSGIKNNDNFERFYDTLKSRTYILTNPGSTVTAKFDSVNVGNLIAISQRLRSQPYGYSFFVFSRINTAIRAATPTNAYLIRRLDEMDDEYINTYNQIMIDELDRTKRIRQ